MSSRRPLHYENFEERVRNYCQRNISDEFTEVELRAITYDYLNVVYRGMWKADDRYSLVEGTIRELKQQLEINDEELIDVKAQLNSAKGVSSRYRAACLILVNQRNKTISFKITKIFNNFKSYFKIRRAV